MKLVKSVGLFVVDSILSVLVWLTVPLWCPFALYKYGLKKGLRATRLILKRVAIDPFLNWDQQ